jgi:hypothetical protein
MILFSGRFSGDLSQSCLSDCMSIFDSSRQWKPYVSCVWKNHYIRYDTDIRLNSPGIWDIPPRRYPLSHKKFYYPCHFYFCGLITECDIVLIFDISGITSWYYKISLKFNPKTFVYVQDCMGTVCSLHLIACVL